MRLHFLLKCLFVVSLLCIVGGMFVASSFATVSPDEATTPTVAASLQPMDVVMMGLVGSGGLILLVRPRRRIAKASRRR